MVFGWPVSIKPGITPLRDVVVGETVQHDFDMFSIEDIIPSLCA